MLLKIKARPGSKEQRIEFFFEQKGREKVPYLKVWLKSPAQKGKANKELDTLLKRLFGDYKLVSGATSKEKLIKVAVNINNVILQKNLENFHNHHSSRIWSLF